jgi:hypothetical protein
MAGLISCRRCSRMFRPSHGNQRNCGRCRARGRPPVLGRVSFGLRRCDCCGATFEAFADHARFCGPWCQRRARARKDRVLYANPAHRGARRRWAPAVASGQVRCARGEACRRAEVVDGERLGGLILPTERWHLGHVDEESSGGPEHVACNTGAPMRLRARRASLR